MFTAALVVLLAFAQATVASTFQLNVQISPNQLTSLKDLHYNLCIAKMVNKQYTVVWSGNQQYLQNNVFEWQESYQVFAANTFQNGALVSVATGIVDIDFNETSILTSEGVMEPATGTVAPGPFFVNNEYGLLNIGVNGILGGTFAPIYVSPSVVEGLETLLPITTVQAWFALSQNTSTMFFNSETPAIEVIYDSIFNATISYSGPDGQGVWAQGPLPPPSSTSIGVGHTSSSSSTFTSTTSVGVGHTSSSSSTFTSTTSPVPSTVQIRYGQCGGLGWSGATACVTGSTCKFLSAYYSQCL